MRQDREAFRGSHDHVNAREEVRHLIHFEFIHYRQAVVHDTWLGITAPLIPRCILQLFLYRHNKRFTYSLFEFFLLWAVAILNKRIQLLIPLFGVFLYLPGFYLPPFHQMMNQQYC